MIRNAYFIKKVGTDSKEEFNGDMEGKLHYTKLPDADNLAKSILDGCNKLLFKDDAQIVSLTSSKHYGKEDYVDVKVEVLKNENT